MTTHHKNMNQVLEDEDHLVLRVAFRFMKAWDDDPHALDRDRIQRKEREYYPPSRPNAHHIIYKAGPDGRFYIGAKAYDPAVSLTVSIGFVTSLPEAEKRPGQPAEWYHFIEEKDRSRHSTKEPAPPIILQCMQDFDNLVERVGKPMTLYTVDSSFVKRKYRGQGVGRRTYYELIKYLGKHGAAIAPDVCGDSTSAMAMGVWNTLKKNFPDIIMVGRIAYLP